MLTDVLLLLVLMVVNGLFAMSEIAVVSSRRFRLEEMAASGSAGAQQALSLVAGPTRFLSSVQVGITAIGILNGAIGEAAIASRLEGWFEGIAALAPYAGTLALATMVLIVTYGSLIVGELVPKRLALASPERIAALVARPMNVVAIAARPIVFVLTKTTDSVVRLLGVRQDKRPGVSVDEVRLMLKQGAEEGVFEPAEQQMATNVLNLDERHVDEVLTPRSEVVYLDVRDTDEANQERLRTHPHDVLPLCDGGLDHVVGFVRSTRVLEQVLRGRDLDLRGLAEPPLFVPERMTMMRLLEELKRSRLPMALAVDEFGEVEGLVSLTDVIAAIVGDLPSEPGEEALIVRRDDGSWLVDGGVELGTVERALRVAPFISGEEREHYHTVGGLAMLALGRVPRTGDVFERTGQRFEVVDMDGNRVDRVLVTPSASRRGRDEH